MCMYVRAFPIYVWNIFLNYNVWYVSVLQTYKLGMFSKL